MSAGLIPYSQPAEQSRQSERGPANRQIESEDMACGRDDDWQFAAVAIPGAAVNENGRIPASRKS
jgi:hypothetical protein